MSKVRSVSPGKKYKRPDFVLDKKTISALDRIKSRYGDKTYAQAIRRAVAFLDSEPRARMFISETSAKQK